MSERIACSLCFSLLMLFSTPLPQGSLWLDPDSIFLCVAYAKQDSRIRRPNVNGEDYIFELDLLMHMSNIKTQGNFKKVQARFIDIPLHGGFNFNGDIYVKYSRFSAYNATTEQFMDFPPMRKVLLLRGTQAEMYFISNVLEKLRFSF